MDLLVDAVVIEAHKAAQVPFFERPDVAVVTAGDPLEMLRGAECDVVHAAGSLDQAGHLDDLVLRRRIRLQLTDEHGVVEQAGHGLKDAGEGVDLDAPVALRVVVELYEADDETAGDQRHAERAGIAPGRVLPRLCRRQARVAGAADGEWLEPGQCLVERRVLRQIHRRTRQPLVRSFAAKADEAVDIGVGDAPDVDAVGVHGVHEPLRQALHEGLHIVRAGDLVRQLDELAHPAVARAEGVLCLAHGERLGADGGARRRETQVRGEVPWLRVADLDGADEVAVGEHRRPDQ